MSFEAMKMNNSTLSDFYRGMKMPNYDRNKPVFAQIIGMNGASTGYQEVVHGEGMKIQKTQQEVVRTVKTTATYKEVVTKEQTKIN